MFADEGYGGKFINEYEDIGNARPAENITYEEAVEKAFKLANEFLELIRPVLEKASEVLRPIVAAINALCPVLNEAGKQIKNIIDSYPNKRVLYLATHGKKARTRKKNINRIIKDLSRG